MSARESKREPPFWMRNVIFSKAYRTRLRDCPLTLVQIRASAGNPQQGWLVAGPHAIPVSLGRGGIKANKFEGDGGTPRGVFHPVRLWWRADRHTRPRTHLPVRAILSTDAWSEDPADRHYNRAISRHDPSQGDRLKRDDHLYDFIIEIDHNTKPRIARRGSAVFIHLARENYSPTAGCVGMTKDAMLRLLSRIGPATRIVIG